MALPDTPALFEFLKELFDTNDEFAQEHSNDFFAQFSNSQNPKLTILKCSDSRVQMESFDKTPQNGVFAIRNIGNQISTSEGSIDFGVEILQTPFLLIIGHSDCGAVTAVHKAVTAVHKKIALDSEAIKRELQTIKISASCIHDAIIENINNQVETALNKYQTRILQKKLVVIGAVYDFKNDFGFGHGKVVLTNINGVTNAREVKKQYLDRIDNLRFLM